ncbi:hypothetical protein ACIBCM_11030 [Streptomyces sp. NPDC051018]|uniref:hypothetical protein n=1 Tax=Streptomyces sp. NPDC051018 TaxID=3365639 RepID=UPI0037B60F65
MPETSSPNRRGRRLVRVAAAFAVLAALIGYIAVQYATRTSAPGCTVRATSGEGGPTYELSTEQAANAATISAVGTTRGLPERAVTIALATALQESALRNIDHGDRDSLGLFQQRPSKGWGTPQQILDPVYSAGKFYDQLAEVPGYSRLPLTVAAQRVQRSGFPQAYAKHEPNATLLAAALTGRADAALTCTPGSAVEKAGDPARVRAELVRDFGPGVLPKKADPRDSAGPREISVPVASAGPGGKRGWELAHWAVARAEGLRIEEVAYGGRIWSAKDSGKGWYAKDTADAETGEARGSGDGRDPAESMAAAGSTVSETGSPRGEVRILLAR